VKVSLTANPSGKPAREKSALVDASALDNDMDSDFATRAAASKDQIQSQGGGKCARKLCWVGLSVLCEG